MTRSSPPSAIGKRTRELQQSESASYSTASPTATASNANTNALTAEHLPTVLESSEDYSHGDASKPRPRAGTMPSTLALGSSAAASHSLPFLNPAPGSMSLPVSGATTPSGEQLHSTDSPFMSSVTANLDQASSHGRLRSGSLTLPAPSTSSAISTAFNNSVFSADWTPKPHGADQGASVTPQDVKSPGGSTIGDDSHVRTLDYLGLDGDISPVGVQGSPWTPAATLAPAPSMQRVGSAGSAGPALGGSASQKLLDQVIRNRSNTIGAISRPRNWSLNAPPVVPSPLATPYSSSALAQHASSTGDYFASEIGSDSHDLSSGRLLYTTNDAHNSANGIATASTLGLSESVRARAATISALEHGRDGLLNSNRRRAGTVPAHHPSLSVDSATAVGWTDSSMPSTQEEQYEADTALTRALHGLSMNSSEARWDGPRPITPEGAISMTPPLQQPTRSLWIGNLDPATSPAEVQAAFGIYGPIESLRILPERECAFVNYVALEDAIRAKEDVLDRIGGKLAKGASMVRIGYGKSDAVSHSPPVPTLRTASAVPTGSGDSLQTVPTRALWIGSLPPDITSNSLLATFAPFGPIESARVLPHKSCGFVNFDKLQDAVAARTALNGKDILGPEVGPLKIGFAKAPPKAIVPLPPEASEIPPGIPTTNTSGKPVIVPPGSELTGGVAYSLPNTSYPTSIPPSSNIVRPQEQQSPYGFVPSGPESPTARIETFLPSSDDWRDIVRSLSGEDDPDLPAHLEALSKPRHHTQYYRTIPLNTLTDPVHARQYIQHDASRLKDLKRRLDSDISQDEVDNIAYDLLDECVPLSSDYIGNTVIQKLFERGSLSARLAMLERIAPHLAAIGTHKNGTWAAQKIIQCAQTDREYELITRALQPFTPPLLLNDFGNYVIQGTQRFGPYAEYIYDAMVDKIWEIGSGRFGARSTRQTLESPHTPKLQLKRVATATVSNAIPLASNANGALLITWYLETSSLPGRYQVLAPRFIPHLVSLCTNKLASVSILKMINQRADPAASRLLVDSIFSSEHSTLRNILSDMGHGTTCIIKILQSTFLTAAERATLVDRVKSELEAMRVTSNPAYRKILEEVGMSSPVQPVATTPSPVSSHSNVGPPPPADYHQPNYYHHHYHGHSPPPFTHPYYSAASAYPYSHSPTFAPPHMSYMMPVTDQARAHSTSPTPVTSPNPITALQVNAAAHHPFNFNDSYQQQRQHHFHQAQGHSQHAQPPPHHYQQHHYHHGQ